MEPSVSSVWDQAQDFGEVLLILLSNQLPISLARYAIGAFVIPKSNITFGAAANEAYIASNASSINMVAEPS